MSEQEHPLEALHQARNAVAMAVSQQARTAQPTLHELYAFGSAIVGTLAQLGNLSSVLADQVGRFDQQELERATTSDDPADKLRVAGTHLARLSDELATAVGDANRYWTAMEHVDLHTSGDLQTRREPDL
ncbi:hypothetical protein SAMN05216215_11135 [Saccharopolyspora shandongensis]|uniref:Excreted virulence factor EspC, type VII ESX diderm n=1 Tax=Saccharopolyspora shandongensis TaxID=418495 RepID=A0A1H3U6T1_9PSEU|nr:hypothetical protein [Saccharopolyspora shandongensis]SDZ58017.1 hypothetical protein SAMN05216215_11135 [Saccharopolyspora shandongensis]